MTSDTGGAAGRLLAAMAASALPADLVRAWNEEAPEPAVGQLWRAAWEAAAEMVLLTSVGNGVVQAVPVTVDADFADQDTVVLTPESTSMGLPLAVWTGLAQDLPLFVLDRAVGEVSAHSFLPADLDAEVRAGRATRGTAVHDAVDRRSEYRARLVDTLNELAEARWAPQGTGELDQLLSAAGLGPADVIAMLSVRPQDALALLRGRLPVTGEQAVVLAGRLSIPAADVLAANPAPPVDLVARLDQPRRRRQLQALAVRSGTDERTARLSAAYGTWRLAARQTGGQTDPAWDDRLDRYFHVTLDD